MAESLADIEALALTCRSDQSKTYMAEALMCYGVGAYRAAIVTSWIAVVFDLIDKIRELSLAGDKQAKTLEAQYETYIGQIEQRSAQGIQSALEFERSILETCRQRLQFFDSHQFVDLERLREDRHRCAHPSFQRVGIPYQPTAEQARLHIRNVIVHVLSQPPVQGKAALAELKAMVASSYFPADDDKALQQLRSSSLDTATDALVRGFVDMLVFGFVTKDDVLFYKQQVVSAINAAFNMYPALVEERLGKQMNKVVRDVDDEQFSGVACLAATVENAWATLQEPSQEKVRAFIANGPKEEVHPVLESLSKIEDLRAAIVSRIENLDFDDVAEAVESHGLGELAKDRALYFLSQARSWDRANIVFTKTVLPVFSALTRGDIERIIRMSTENNADLPGARGYELFIKKVREGGLINDDDLNQMLKENGASYLLRQPQ